eukprot:jgi/Mesen1/5529/ME000279S04736
MIPDIEFGLFNAYDSVVPARGKALVKTDLSIAIPEGTYARIAPRSGLAWKHSIDVGAGVVDADYRGNVGVILFNFSDQDYAVKEGDRVAQLILERIVTPEVEEVSSLEDTARGEGGFGSTGISGTLTPGATTTSVTAGYCIKRTAMWFWEQGQKVPGFKELL